MINTICLPLCPWLDSHVSSLQNLYSCASRNDTEKEDYKVTVKQTYERNAV